MAIANVIGAKSRHDGYMEGGGFIVSWCFGHLADCPTEMGIQYRYR